MDNTIPRRIYDFLKNYPPFNLLPKDQLLQIAARILIRYHQVDDYIFRQGDQPDAHIYVVREGAVHLMREEEGQRTIVETCDEGDVFGIRPLLARENYLLSAQVIEESLVYAIPVDVFSTALSDNPQVALYLATTFASGAGQRYTSGQKPSLFLDHKSPALSQFNLVELQSLERSKQPVSCGPDTSIKDAAVIMSEKEVGSIIVVDKAMKPLGIVTDKDFRKKVVSGQVGLSAAVSEIMSSPVLTISPKITVADVQIEMVKHRINHLCITEDGSRHTKVIGVISEHDLMVTQGNNPAILIKEIQRSYDSSLLKNIRERAEALLKRYIYQEVAISFISTVMTEINDAIIQQCLTIAEASLDEEQWEKPAARYCWLALGSEGRSEQLLRTDQDSALVFEEVEEAQYEATKTYYLELASRTTALLNQIGFEYCPADMMASNPSWCLSLAEWKAQFSSWITEPTPKAVMYCTIFFDFRPIRGLKELAGELANHIFAQLDGQTIFLSFLARTALKNPPPLTFFRNFVVESGGEHKDEFDIKARAMMPLADAARVLILNARVSRVNNTFKRFEKMAELEPNNKELYEQAASAYEVLMRYRTLKGLKNADSGRFFKPTELTKMQRINLRNSFLPIKDLQTLLRVRFQLALLGG
jgi:CBS domain-containing protein